MTKATPLWRTRRFRIALGVGIVGGLLLVLILQNFERVYVEFIFGELRAPLAVVIFLSMLIGAGIETVARLLWRRRRRHQEEVRAARAAGAAERPPEG